MRLVVTIASAALLTAVAAAQTAFREAPVTNQDWIKPFPALHIVGNVYYVGTYDLASYLNHH